MNCWASSSPISAASPRARDIDRACPGDCKVSVSSEQVCLQPSAPLEPKSYSTGNARRACEKLQPVKDPFSMAHNEDSAPRRTTFRDNVHKYALWSAAGKRSERG